MVELKDVSVTYSSGVDALNHVSLKINDGDFAFVVGSSGAGKSTMIKLLLKEIDATEGTVIVNGYNLSRLRRRKIPELRRTIGRLRLSARAYDRILRVARTIADLRGAEGVSDADIMEAAGYRQLDDEAARSWA